MRAILTPQRSDRRVAYSAADNVLTVTMGAQSDVFDFSDMPDGRATHFETTLPVCPVVSAERVDGVLTVKLLHWYGAGADDEEKRERKVTI